MKIEFKSREQLKSFSTIDVEVNMQRMRERLAFLRKERGLTQQRFSQAIGAGRSNVAAWETGRRKPDIFELLKISEFYNVSIDYLLGLTEGRRERMRRTDFLRW